MFEDEATFGRMDSPKACWAPLPLRPVVARQTVREYVYAFGAVSPQDGKHDSLVLPYVNNKSMSYFLEEIARRYPDEYILMFMDRAGWHLAKALKIPPNIELAFLPSYAPELNPQEQVWDELREKFFANRFFRSLNAVVDTLVEGLQHIESRPHALAQLTRRP
jgi:transposase